MIRIGYNVHNHSKTLYPIRFQQHLFFFHLKPAGRYFICHSCFIFLIRNSLLVIPALYSSPNLDRLSQFKTFRITRVSSPANARNIHRLAIRHPHRQQQIRNFPARRRLSVKRYLANISVKKNTVFIGSNFLSSFTPYFHLSCKHRQFKAVSFPLVPVIRTELP